MIDKKPQCGEHRHQDDAKVLYGFFLYSLKSYSCLQR